jgi:chromate transporter
LKDLKEIILLFSKLGLIAFGGPAAHIAMFEDEVVTKRKWMSRQHFLDLVGATNLIPGPNSTEMALHCGYYRAGFPGLVAAGISFILPAVVISGVLAYFYVRYGNLPEIYPFLYGIKPAVIIIILNAVYRLGQKAVWDSVPTDKRWKLISIALSVAVLNLFGASEIFSILAGGIFGAFFIYLSERRNILGSISHVAFLALYSITHLINFIEKSEVSLTKLFLTCLKIGTVWFGGGYILVAYFDGEFVQGLNWLSRQQLLDAIAVGQFTPGPFLSSVTFVGYQIAGITGALIATIGIIIPSFVFVLILNPLIPRIRRSNILSKFLDAVNVSAVAVMLIVAIKLGYEVLADMQTTLIALLSAAVFFSIKKINPAYIILGGAVLGYLIY